MVAVWAHVLVGRDVHAGVWVLCLQVMGSCAACVVSYGLAWLAAWVFGRQAMFESSSRRNVSHELLVSICR